MIIFNFLILGFVLSATHAITLHTVSGRTRHSVLNSTESSPPNHTSCISPSVRQEWNSVTQDVRDNYIAASLCLVSKPSRIGLNSTLYDDFPWVHNQLAGESQFLPILTMYFTKICSLFCRSILTMASLFHPLPRESFAGVWIYGNSTAGPLFCISPEANRNRYLDWTLISADPVDAAVFSPTTGVGGTGNGTTGCVDKGPYASLKPAYFGDFEGGAPGCLTRRFNNDVDRVPSEGAGKMQGAHYSPETIASIMKNSTFGAFSVSLENEPHNAFHAAIGGDMGPQTSPNGKSIF